MTHADIIIIGGGIAGGSLAAKIAPHAKVILLEAEDSFGYHATGRSAAMFEPFYGNDVIRTLTRASEAEHIAADVLTPRGVVYLAGNGPRAREALAEVENVEGMQQIPPAEAVKMVPILRLEKISEAVLGTDAQDIDVDKLFQGFLRKSRAAGAELKVKSGVTGLRYDGQWHVSTGDAEYTAPIIVNAAGPWADKIAEMAGIAPLGIQPFRRSMAILPTPKGHDVSDWPMILSDGWYAKPDAGKWLVSPCETDPMDPMDAWPDDMVLAEGIARYQEFVSEEVTRIEHSWAGLRSFAPDRTPVVGFADGVQGFFWLAGQGGYGIETSPAMSDLAADLLRGVAPSLDAETVAALSPERFA